MRAGQLRHRVLIQSGTDTRGSAGGLVRTWSDVATVWAAVEPLTGNELMQAQQVEARATVRIRMRYYSTLTSKHRITYDSRAFNIVSVVNRDERNREMVVLCTEVD